MQAISLAFLGLQTPLPPPAKIDMYAKFSTDKRVEVNHLKGDEGVLDLIFNLVEPIQSSRCIHEMHK